MWLVNKMEICFSKIGFVDSKWSRLVRPTDYSTSSFSIIHFFSLSLINMQPTEVVFRLKGFEILIRNFPFITL